MVNLYFPGPLTGIDGESQALSIVSQLGAARKLRGMADGIDIMSEMGKECPSDLQSFSNGQGLSDIKMAGVRTKPQGIDYHDIYSGKLRQRRFGNKITIGKISEGTDAVAEGSTGTML